jgi:hypothetical protein
LIDLIIFFFKIPLTINFKALKENKKANRISSGVKNHESYSRLQDDLLHAAGFGLMK